MEWKEVAVVIPRVVSRTAPQASNVLAHFSPLAQKMASLAISLARVFTRLQQ